MRNSEYYDTEDSKAGHNMSIKWNWDKTRLSFCLYDLEDIDWIRLTPERSIESAESLDAELDRHRACHPDLLKEVLAYADSFDGAKDVFLKQFTDLLQGPHGYREILSLFPPGYGAWNDEFFSLETKGDFGSFLFDILKKRSRATYEWVSSNPEL